MDINHKSLKNALIEIGLDSDEADVFIYIAQQQNSITISKVAKSTNIPRSTTYRICKRLVEKHLAVWVVGERGQEVKKADTKTLDLVIENKKLELDKTEKAINKVSELVSSNFGGIPYTQIRYYAGVEGLKQIIWNTLEAKNEIIGYSQFGRVNLTGSKFYDRYVREFKRRGITDRVLSNQSCLGYVDSYVVNNTHQMTQDDIRIIDENEFYVSGDISIYNDIYAASWWDKGEIVGVEIENPELVRVQKSIFNLLWQKGKKLNEI